MLYTIGSYRLLQNGVEVDHNSTITLLHNHEGLVHTINNQYDELHRIIYRLLMECDCWKTIQLTSLTACRIDNGELYVISNDRCIPSLKLVVYVISEQVANIEYSRCVVYIVYRGDRIGRMLDGAIVDNIEGIEDIGDIEDDVNDIRNVDDIEDDIDCVSKIHSIDNTRTREDIEADSIELDSISSGIAIDDVEDIGDIRDIKDINDAKNTGIVIPTDLNHYHIGLPNRSIRKYDSRIHRHLLNTTVIMSWNVPYRLIHYPTHPGIGQLMSHLLIKTNKNGNTTITVLESRGGEQIHNSSCSHSNCHQCSEELVISASSMILHQFDCVWIVIDVILSDDTTARQSISVTSTSDVTYLTQRFRSTDRQLQYKRISYSRSSNGYTAIIHTLDLVINRSLLFLPFNVAIEYILTSEGYNVNDYYCGGKMQLDNLPDAVKVKVAGLTHQLNTLIDRFGYIDTDSVERLLDGCSMVDLIVE